MSRASPQRLRFATWNIHSGIGGDRHFDMGRIVEVLDEMDADVVGLQEVGWHRRSHHRLDQFAYLREHTGYRVIEGLVRDPLRAQFGNALLTRLPAGKTRWIDLKVRGHVPRAALVAELQAETTPLQVAVLHLGLTVWERERQTQRLMAAMREEEKPAERGPPAVLLGDFNMLRRRTRASEILAGRFPACVRLPTYPARGPRLSLDRIYLSAEWDVTDARVWDSDLALHASDHLPLVAEALCGPDRSR
ncbi:endonuclease/exonuclease/phosphatase family protein [Pelagibius sp. CAU 1746]|uniref:endonuclease/exonuclease/phosphatase family protein n=1 Tax=Pelagibius sp. CAU 1746 TaxID=3140370 RepID=UPI00325BB122